MLAEARDGGHGKDGGPARFPRALRLPARRDFRHVFDRGRSRADEHLILYACPREDQGPGRLGLVVGRRFGPSVIRNRFKRRIREAFRNVHGTLPEGHDIVVLPRTSGHVPPAEDAELSLRELSRAAAGVYARMGPR